MKPASFQSEQWMTEYEHQARVNLTDSSADALSFEELMAFEPELFRNLTLDYGTIEGDPRLKTEILSFYKNRNPKTLALAHGCSEAIRLAMEVLLESGDHVITFSPGYQQFWEIPQKMGCEVSLLPLNEEDWSLPLFRIENALRHNTRLIILNNPNNPTGKPFSKEDLAALIELAAKYDLYILCDEVYLYPDEDYPSLSDLYEKAVCASSLSKTLGLPGLRSGWVKGPEEVIHDINLARDYSLISTGPLSDMAALCALRHRDEIRAPIAEVIEENRQTVEAWLKDHPDFDWVNPQGGSLGLLKMKGVADSAHFCRMLLRETGIFFVPGSCFKQEGSVRIGLGFHHENLARSLDETADFLHEYLKRTNRHND